MDVWQIEIDNDRTFVAQTMLKRLRLYTETFRLSVGLSS